MKNLPLNSNKSNTDKYLNTIETAKLSETILNDLNADRNLKQIIRKTKLRNILTTSTRFTPLFLSFLSFSNIL